MNAYTDELDSINQQLEEMQQLLQARPEQVAAYKPVIERFQQRKADLQSRLNKPVASSLGLNEGITEVPDKAAGASLVEALKPKEQKKSSLKSTIQAGIQGIEGPKEALSEIGQETKDAKKEEPFSLKSKLSEADQSILEAKREYKAEKEAVERGELFDLLGRRLGQFAAGQAGVDISEQASKPTFDWAGRRKGAQEDYQIALAEAGNLKKELREQMAQELTEARAKEVGAKEKEELILQKKAMSLKEKELQETIRANKAKEAKEAAEILAKSPFDQKATLDLGSKYEEDDTIKSLRARANNYEEAKELAEEARKGNAQAGVALTIRLARMNNPTGAMSDKDIEQALRDSAWNKLGIDPESDLASNVKSLYNKQVNKEMMPATINATMSSMRSIIRGNMRAAEGVKADFIEAAGRVKADPEFIGLRDKRFRERNPEVFEQEKTKEEKEQEKFKEAQKVGKPKTGGLNIKQSFGSVEDFKRALGIMDQK